jgi:hypothetical protein
MIKRNRSDNSIQFFVINVLSQQLQRQLQTQHNVHIGNKIKSNNNNNNTFTIASDRSYGHLLTSPMKHTLLHFGL